MTSIVDRAAKLGLQFDVRGLRDFVLVEPEGWQDLRFPERRCRQRVPHGEGARGPVTSHGVTNLPFGSVWLRGQRKPECNTCLATPVACARPEGESRVNKIHVARCRDVVVSHFEA